MCVQEAVSQIIWWSSLHDQWDSFLVGEVHYSSMPTKEDFLDLLQVMKKRHEDGSHCERLVSLTPKCQFTAVWNCCRAGKSVVRKFNQVLCTICPDLSAFFCCLESMIELTPSVLCLCISIMMAYAPNLACWGYILHSHKILTIQQGEPCYLSIWSNLCRLHKGCQAGKPL